MKILKFVAVTLIAIFTAYVLIVKNKHVNTIDRIQRKIGSISDAELLHIENPLYDNYECVALRYNDDDFVRRVRMLPKSNFPSYADHCGDQKIQRIETIGKAKDYEFFTIDLDTTNKIAVVFLWHRD